MLFRPPPIPQIIRLSKFQTVIQNSNENFPSHESRIHSSSLKRLGRSFRLGPWGIRGTKLTYVLLGIRITPFDMMTEGYFFIHTRRRPNMCYMVGYTMSWMIGKNLNNKVNINRCGEGTFKCLFKSQARYIQEQVCRYR